MELFYGHRRPTTCLRFSYTGARKHVHATVCALRRDTRNWPKCELHFAPCTVAVVDTGVAVVAAAAVMIIEIAVVCVPVYIVVVINVVVEAATA